MDTSEETKNTVPAIPSSLLKWMEEMWPEKTPIRGATMEDIQISIGHREVIRKLRAEYDHQNENILNNN